MYSEEDITFGNADGIPYIVIDNVFNEDEVKRIQEEFVRLKPALLPPELTQGAKTVTNGYVKKNKAVFLSDVYNNPDVSDIYKLSRRIFNPIMVDLYMSKDPMWRLFRYPLDTHYLVSYYEEDDSYEKHKDLATATLLYWQNQEPLQFEGGDLVLEEDTVIPYKSNRCVIFPSFTYHAVTPVKMLDVKTDMPGRCVLSIFFNISSY